MGHSVCTKFEDSSFMGVWAGATENASTENESTGGWNMQVRKTPVRICNGGKRKYSNLKSILKSYLRKKQSVIHFPTSLENAPH